MGCGHRDAVPSSAASPLKKFSSENPMLKLEKGGSYDCDILDISEPI
jgi:hypothetical protein